jgi:predicted enzyme related to lactoylglutathione lyase
MAPGPPRKVAPMARREQYPPGTFSWVELGTTDDDAAKAFYASLFGWAFTDLPVANGGVYSMASLGGDDVAALYERRSAEPPPAWLSYVTVADADQTAARVTELGGTVASDPFDVMDAGRMAVVQDPQGAVLALWQPGRHIGARRVNQPGALAWNDLATTDPQGAQRFYAELFGWEFALVTAEPFRYWTVSNGGSSNGGMMALGPGMENDPPHWRAYFGVDDVDASLQTARANGGQVVVGPITVPAGRFAAATDPQGALFCLVEGEFDD